MWTSLSVAVLVTNSVFLALAVLAVFLRVLLRCRSTHGFGKDDWLIIVALLFATGLALTNVVGVPVGHFGEPYERLVREGNTAIFLKFTFAWQFFYILAVTAVKLSFLFFYGRLFHSVSFHRLQIVLIWLVCAWATAFFFTTIFQVWPIACNWYYCPMTMDYPVMYVCTSVTAILLDLAIFILPLLMLRNIAISSGKRNTLAVIFSLGVFCVIASVARLVYTVIFMGSIRDGNFAANFNNSAVNISMWSGIEACASTICACLPFFGPYVSRIPILRHMARSTFENSRRAEAGTTDRYTGGPQTSKSRGRSKHRRFSPLGAAQDCLFSPGLAANCPDQIEALGKESIEDSLSRTIVFGSDDSEGVPTLRDEFESEVEMGKISLRTRSN